MKNTVVLNGYEYTVYGVGSVVGAGWLVSEKAQRDTKTQLNAGGESRKEDDHGGHLFPTCLNGAGDSYFNVFAQNDKLNMGDMKSWELERVHINLDKKEKKSKIKI